METNQPHRSASHGSSQASDNELAPTNKKPTEELLPVSPTTAGDSTTRELLPAPPTIAADSITKELLSASPTTAADPTNIEVKREYTPAPNQHLIYDKGQPRLSEKDRGAQIEKNSSYTLQDNRKPRESVGSPPLDLKERCPTCKQPLPNQLPPTTVRKQTLADILPPTFAYKPLGDILKPSTIHKQTLPDPLPPTTARKQTLADILPKTAYKPLGGTLKRPTSRKRELGGILSQATNYEQNLGDILSPATAHNRTLGDILPPTADHKQGLGDILSPTTVDKRALSDTDTHSHDTKRRKPDNSSELMTQASKEEHITDWISSVSGNTEGPPSESVSQSSSIMAPPTPHSPYFRSESTKQGIFIQSGNISPNLRQRAEDIINCERQMHDSTADLDDIIGKSFAMRDRAENSLRQILSPALVPGYSELPQGLDTNHGKQWRRCIPIAAAANRTPQLPDPKPELPYGYSMDVFTISQIDTMERFEMGGRSYVEPVARVYFPFFNFEMKSELKGGLYVGENQCASTGAVAMQGFFLLVGRTAQLQSFDISEPQFFSIAANVRSAKLYVHWVGGTPIEGQAGYYMRELQSYDLGSRNGVASLRRAVLNIYDWARQTRLPKILELLDVYGGLPPPDAR